MFFADVGLKISRFLSKLKRGKRKPVPGEIVDGFGYYLDEFDKFQKREYGGSFYGVLIVLFGKMTPRERRLFEENSKRLEGDFSKVKQGFSSLKGGKREFDEFSSLVGEFNKVIEALSKFVRDLVDFAHEKVQKIDVIPKPPSSRGPKEYSDAGFEMTRESYNEFLRSYSRFLSKTDCYHRKSINDNTLRTDFLIPRLFCIHYQLGELRTA